MYNITDCCRVCLKEDNSFVDIIKTQTKTNSLINKLKLCVSEVEWSTNNSILMCPTCIDKLNSAYEFKNQCLESTKLFKNYTVELSESQSKKQKTRLNRDDANKDHESKTDLTVLSIQPNQPNILLKPNQNNSFQNIFLNILPSTTIKLSQPNISLVNQNPPFSNTDTNQTMILIDNTVHKILPVVPTNDVTVIKPLEDVNISKILNESNSEELSVEIDPTCFDCMPEDDIQVQPEESTPKDWEDLILTNKITPETKLICTDESFDNKFVPIQPKLNDKENNYLMNDLFYIDHFMANKHQVRTAVCEDCGQMCDNIKSLHAHIKQVHSGNFPYRCKQCYSVYALQTQFEAHMRKHDVQKPDTFTKDMITLDDLSQHNESILFPSLAPSESANTELNIDEVDDEGVPDLSLEFKCRMCPTSFSNAPALSKHRFKKHQQTRKKYFVKGMKNAKCDICNREFSTQSYLQLHIKLHFRKMGYRFKVFDKDRYVTDKKDDIEKDADDTEFEKCDKSLEHKSVEEEQNSENGIDAIEELDTNAQGLKIKINLKSLKEPEEAPQILEQIDVTDVTPMEVDPPSEEAEHVETNNVEAPLQMVTASQPIENDEHMDSEENSKDEDTLNIKDEVLPEIQPPSIRAELVSGKQQCSFCLKVYRRKHDLKRHLNNIHLKAIQYVCHLCSTPFYEAFQLTRHLRQHNGFVRCGLCYKEYSILRDLKLHMNAAHDNTALCQCGSCGQSFQKVRHLREHMTEHDKSIIYKCHICTEEFRESRDLSRHLVEHSGMYACNICHTTFSAEQELNNHSKCHSDDPGNERKYKCEICPSKFKKKRYLMAHVRKTHASKSVDIVPTRIELDCKSA